VKTTATETDACTSRQHGEEDHKSIPGKVTKKKREAQTEKRQKSDKNNQQVQTEDLPRNPPSKVTATRKEIVREDGGVRNHLNQRNGMKEDAQVDADMR